MMHEREPSQEQYQGKTEEIRENGSLNTSLFYEVLDISNEINKLCDIIYKEVYDKRVRLLGQMATDNNVKDEPKKSEDSWINNIKSNQEKAIKKLLEIKDVIESI